MNGDGKIDIVTDNGGDNTASVLLNAGTGTFGAKTDYTTGSDVTAVALADFNNDGKSDITTANYTPNTISVLLNSPSKTLFASGSNGRVGIGTTTPLAQLDVVGVAGSGDIFRLASSTGTALLTMKSTGYLGIGTTTPGALLTVVGTTSATCFSVSGGACLTANNSGTAGQIAFYSSSGTAVSGTSTITISGEKVGIGTTTPGALLTVAGTTSATCFSISGGTCLTSSQWVTSSSDIYYNTGNVGIGTTTPYAKLTVSGMGLFDNIWASSTTATSTFAGNLDVGSGAITYNNASGLTNIANLQIGATSFETNAGMLSWVDMPVTSSATAGTVESYSAQIDGNPLLTVYSESDGSGGIQNSRIGIGTTTPTKTLSVVGTVSLTGLSAAGSSYGALCLNDTTKEVYVNTGAQTCTVSSLRFKNSVETLTATSGLAFVNQLRPVSYKYNSTGEAHVGFIAEEVAALDSRLIFTETGSTTPRGVRYEEMTAVLAKAIQELDVKVNAGIATTSANIVGSAGFFALLTDWFGSATNGITDFFANRVRTKTLCVGDETAETCISKTELDALLNSANVNGVPQGGDTTSDDEATTTPDISDTNSDDDVIASSTDDIATSTEDISTDEDAESASGTGSDEEVTDTNEGEIEEETTPEEVVSDPEEGAPTSGDETPVDSETESESPLTE